MSDILEQPSSSCRWVSLAIVGSSGTLLTLLFTALGPILPALAAHFRGGAHGALISQSVLSVSTTGLIVGYSLWGWVCEHVQPRWVLACGFALYAVAGSAGLYLETTTLLFVSRFAAGFAAAGVSSSSIILISELLPRPAQARVISWSNFAGTVAGVLSSLAAGALAQIAGWRSPFVLYLFGLLLLSGVGCVRSSNQGPRSAIKRRVAGSLDEISLIYLGIFVMYIAMFANFSQLPFLAESRGIAGPRALSRLIAIYTFCLGVGSLMYPILSARLSTRFILVAMIAAMACGEFFLALAANPVSIGVGAIVSALPAGILNVYFPLLVITKAPAEVKGRAVGFLFTAMFLGDFASPIVVYSLRHLFDLKGAFIVIGGLLSVASVFSLASVIRKEKSAVF